ncbi:MAG: UDP-3-O-(3-hydroxymyristoyl)glucosamine N-acyltransferase [bacterium]
MPDSRFFTKSAAKSLREICQLTGAQLQSELFADRLIETVTDPQDKNNHNAIGWVGDKSVAQNLEHPEIAAILTTKELSDYITASDRTALLLHDNPRAAFAILAENLITLNSELAWEALSTEQINSLSDCQINPTAIIAETAKIGRGTKIGAGTVIGPGVEIGENCVIGSNCTIICSVLSNNVTIAAGVVIGEGGFGFVPLPDRPVAVPQLGFVEIKEHVSIGSNSTIDRGSLGNTIIGAYSKLDNLCHVAHNVEIGQGCMIAGQCGISGSSRIGHRVMMGGQVGVADHVVIGDDAILVARAGIMRDVPAKEKHAGFPSRPARQFFKETSILAKLAKK